MFPLFIHTLRGWQLRWSLDIAETEESIPCGRCITTTYHYKGVLVRQDQNIVIDPDKVPVMFGVVNDLT
jgi:hypothetical protein